MPLKALDIYKILPRKNCKECGFPTCLAFAMKIASGKVDPDSCPYLDKETKRRLGTATRPPVRLVRIGVGDRKVVVGEETVLFRHEKTFYHPPGLMVEILDTWEKERIEAMAGQVEDEMFTRVGQDLYCNGVAIRNVSRSPEVFRKAVAIVEGRVSLPEILMADDPLALEAGLAECGTYRPLLHVATENNYTVLCGLAKKFGCPLCVRSGTLEGLADLTTKCSKEGIEDLVLDPAPSTLRDFLVMSTEIRRSAVDRLKPEVGYPVFCDTTLCPEDVAAGALGILKYAGVIVTKPLEYPRKLALLTLRQNIYTDPQKPIQMSPGLYPVNNPGRQDPVLITVNFSLTYFTVLGYLEGAKIPCHLLVVDTEGLSVLTAVAAGKLNEVLIKDALKKFNVEESVDHRTLVLPGYAAPLSGRVEETSGWKVKVGPRDAADLPEFLEKGVV
ncbi:MAG: acetyl-CoA decarbonylase/synthase complex subunit gamma [Methanomicrobiales archaeon]|nr:acetyl-CoA decarbonylase/synthase complex subunit gamma [Methanomicrobiales archaeon]